MATTSSQRKSKNFFQRLFPGPKKERDQLQSFGDRQESERAYDPVDRGISMVPLENIVGSVGRYRDFDSQFTPKTISKDERLQGIIAKMKAGKALPPISLYQIKDDYFILDGHHRVTAAKRLGHTHIRACILELLPTADTLENRLYKEQIEFRDRAGLPHAINLTELGQFPRLDWQIREHQSYLSEERDQDISYQQAALDWYRTIYKPLATVIQNNGLIKSFQGRTVDDLYLYISVHQWENGQKRKYGIDVDKLIPRSMEEFRDQMAEHKEQEYPEMLREITAFILLNVEGKHEQEIFDKLLELDEVTEIHSVHGSIDIIVKVVLTRDLLSVDGELLTQFLLNTIRQWRGIQSTQTLIPGLAIIKDSSGKEGLQKNFRVL